MDTKESIDQRVILLTGSSGLIGNRICRRLADRFHLIGLDIEPPQDSSIDVDYIETDLTDTGSVESALLRVKNEFGERLASVLHLAAYYDFSGEPSPLYDELTVEGTRRLLRGLRKYDFQVGQFVFSSSLLVMKPDERGRQISELSSTRAEWDYPKSKLKAENVIREERGSIPIVILRIAGVYDEECHALPLSQQIARIYEKQFESYVFPGDASHGQAMVHIEDVVKCLECVINRRQELGEQSLFLIAEPDVIGYAQLQERLGEMIHGEEWPAIRIPKPVAKAGAWVQEKISEDDDAPFIRPWMIDLADDHYAPTINRAKTKLGWEPEYKLEETLPAMIEFLRSDPERFYRENGLPVSEFAENVSED